MSLLGERLRLAREARGVAALQVEIDTRIRATVINALEQGDYESLPPEPFLRGLIRTYAMYLGLDAEEMVRLYVADFAPPPPPPTEPVPRPVPPAPQSVEPPLPPPTVPIIPPSNTPGASLFARFNDNGAPPPPETFGSEPPATMPELPEKQNAMPTAQMIFSRRLPSIMPTRLPMPVIFAIGIAIAVMLLVCVAFVFTQGLPALAAMINPPRTATPTRAPATRTPAPINSAPTSVPTFAATAPPFATFAGNVTPAPTARTTPRRTIEPAQTGLDLTIEAVEKVTVHIGLDGALVFTGTLDPGTTRSWSAKESLYVRLENAKGAALIFNGKAQAAKTFAERTTMERQWTLNPKGTPVAVPPVEPPPIAPTPPAATPTLTPTA
ncbi:MAG: DUF4115 domain-containing protein [Chloroflexi bacterium]|nr:DUF4115 domain-containing protein [Chloroflexota bacterium]